jgi:hypothetical protein
MEKHEQVDQDNLDALNAELAQIAAEEAAAKAAIEEDMDTFVCNDCGNTFDIEDSTNFPGSRWICCDCLRILEEQVQDVEDNPIPENTD